MPRSFSVATQPIGFAPPKGLDDRSRAISQSRCWSRRDVREASVDMLTAICRLAPTHHSKVYCATKSPRSARFIANASRFGALVAAGVDDGAGASAERDAAGAGVSTGFAASGARAGVGDALGDGVRACATVAAGVGAVSVGVHAASVTASALSAASAAWGR